MAFVQNRYIGNTEYIITYKDGTHHVFEEEYTDCYNEVFTGRYEDCLKYLDNEEIKYLENVF